MMPVYQAIKRVRAAKITQIDDRSVVAEDSLIAVDTGDVIQVPPRYIEKHEPQVGGYLVEYEGGYLSWSPAEVFEQGYRPVEADDA